MCAEEVRVRDISHQDFLEVSITRRVEDELPFPNRSHDWPRCAFMGEQEGKHRSPLKD